MTNNVRIKTVQELITPRELSVELPNTYQNKITGWRQEIESILSGKDQRIIIVVGPCSIHDIKSAKEYAQKLLKLSEEMRDVSLLVMRVYFEKPRTTIGWKGLINDPDLDCSYNINKGLRMAREFLLYLAEIGLPSGCEFLDTISPQYISDLVSWGAIGARTTESQIHRELASGLSMPIGFKNGTGGGITMAINAIKASHLPHRFLGVSDKGRASIVHTTGNLSTHIILRGGKSPNYYERDINNVEAEMVNNNIQPCIMIDCSHGNSQKIFQRQTEICTYVINLIKKYQKHRKTSPVKGLMIESNLYEGSQKLTEGSSESLRYGVSITDACISWEDTEKLLLECRDSLL